MSKANPIAAMAQMSHCTPVRPRRWPRGESGEPLKVSAAIGWSRTLMDGRTSHQTGGGGTNCYSAHVFAWRSENTRVINTAVWLSGGNLPPIPIHGRRHVAA